MATGVIQFVGTAISSGDFSGFAKSRAFDGNPLTEWAASAADNGWIGLDLGAAAIVTAYSIMPGRASDNGAPGTEDLRPIGGTFQGASASDFGTALVTYDTYAAGLPFRPSNVLTKKPIVGGSKRYWRFAGAAGSYGGALAELRIYGVPTGSTTFRPCPPRILPWGGPAIGGTSPEITLTCATTSAAIYYTIDGSAPDNTDTLYSGPFTIAVGGDVVLKAVAYDASCSTPLSEVSTANFRTHAYAPNGTQYDQDGEIAEIHNPTIAEFPVGSGVFWMATTSGNTGKHSWDALGKFGLWIYRGVWAADGKSIEWSNCGNVVGIPASWTYLVRPSFLVNGNGDLTLWAHAFNLDRVNDRAYTWKCLAGSDPAKREDWIDCGAINPNGQGFWDGSRFEFQGEGYVIYSRDGNDRILVSKLAADYMTCTGSAIELPGVTYPSESPVAFEYPDPTNAGAPTLGIIFNSPSNYYDAASLFGFYTMKTTDPLDVDAYVAKAQDFFAVDPTGTSYNGQCANIWKVPGKVRAWVMLADFWTNTSGAYGQYTSRYVWYPIDISTGKPKATLPATWDMSTFADAEGSGGISAAAARRMNMQTSRTREGQVAHAAVSNAAAATITAFTAMVADKTIKQAVEAIGDGIRFVDVPETGSARPLFLGIGAYIAADSSAAETAAIDVYGVRKEGDGLGQLVLEKLADIDCTFTSQTDDVPASLMPSGAAGTSATAVTATSTDLHADSGGEAVSSTNRPAMARISLPGEYLGIALVCARGSAGHTVFPVTKKLWE